MPARLIDNIAGIVDHIGVIAGPANQRVGTRVRHSACHCHDPPVIRLARALPVPVKFASAATPLL